MKNEELKALGHTTVYRQDYAPEVLETFANKHPEKTTIGCASTAPSLRASAPSPGSLTLPKYASATSPAERMVESKSLKLYLFSFRGHGAFHEDCVNIIMKDLIRLMDPKYIEVTGIFTPRGGISIYPYANYGRPGTKYEEMARYRLMNHDLK